MAALEPFGRLGDSDVSAEFLCLNKCTVGKFLPRNSHGKTEIVLNPGTRSGLSTRSVLLQNEDLQTLGRSIDSRGQPTWSGADYNHVVHIGLIDSGVQSQAGCRFGITWIAQGNRTATD